VKEEIKYSKRFGKYATVSAIILISSIMVTGAFISYFGRVETTAEAVSPITIDGKGWDQKITHNIDPAVGGCCYCFKHHIENIGCKSLYIDWETTPTYEGIIVSFHEDCVCRCSNPLMEFPRWIEPGETLHVCICYEFHPLIMPGSYTMMSKLILTPQ